MSESISPAYMDVRERTCWTGGVPTHVTLIQRETTAAGIVRTQILVYQVVQPKALQGDPFLERVFTVDATAPWWISPTQFICVSPDGKRINTFDVSSGTFVRYEAWSPRLTEVQRVGNHEIKLYPDGRLTYTALSFGAPQAAVLIAANAARPILIPTLPEPVIYYRLPIAPGRTTTDQTIAVFANIKGLIVDEFKGGEGKHLAVRVGPEGIAHVLRGDGEVDRRRIGSNGWLDSEWEKIYTVLAGLPARDPFWAGEFPGFEDAGGNLWVLDDDDTWTLVGNAGPITAANLADHNPVGVPLNDGSWAIAHGDTTVGNGDMLAKLTHIPWTKPVPTPKPPLDIVIGELEITRDRITIILQMLEAMQ